MSEAIAVLFAPGFEEIEAISIVDTLRRADFPTLMVGIDDLSVQGAHGIEIAMDVELPDIDPDAIGAVVLPGGMPGAEHLADNEAVRDLLRDVDEAEGIVAAICAAPIALDAAGLLDGKRYTCYPGFEDRIDAGERTGARVEVDGRIITGIGPGAAIEFALELVAQLGKRDVARKLRQAMQVKD